MKIKSLVPIKGHLMSVDIYGHRGRGIPGINVQGTCIALNFVKEKFYYLSKECGMHIPLAKYGLCIEFSADCEFNKKDIEWKWLELPLLILYWSLAGVLPISNLKHCFVCGKISVNRMITYPLFHQNVLLSFFDDYREKNNSTPVLIAPKQYVDQNFTNHEKFNWICMEDLLENKFFYEFSKVENLRFR